MVTSNLVFLAWNCPAVAGDDDDEDDEDNKGEPEESLSAFPDLVPENRLSSSGEEEHK